MRGTAACDRAVPNGGRSLLAAGAPYGGQFDEVMPRLTIAHTVDPARFDEIEADVGTRLPLRTEVTEAQLLAFDGQRWTPRLSIVLGSAGHDSQ